MPDHARRVLVFAETVRDQWSPLTREAVAAARLLAGEVHAAVCVVLLGAEVSRAAEAQPLGANVVYRLAGPMPVCYEPEAYAEGAGQAFRELQPSVAIFPHSSQGEDLAVRLALSVGAPLAIGCLSVRPSHEGIVLTKSLGGGKLREDHFSPLPLVLTLRPGSMGAPAAVPALKGTILPLEPRPLSHTPRFRHLGHLSDDRARTASASAADRNLCLNRHCRRAYWNRLCGETRVHCPMRGEAEPPQGREAVPRPNPIV